ncbi:MAG: hypothetical protein NC344_10015 [Bacteroidales bacterium]|nr:hypothetical protein [Bacteroidales bacterium]MCM1148139.1 hypothetical protein [Bacteroidales bacterium]MCM1206555.1 hypothetical protein [Bacillota bacterium]MCM1510543.1 hypothetical protein [Clostridium sp.]
MNRLFYLILFLSLALTAMATSQKQFDREAYEKEQHQFIIQKAKLTQEEANKFFAIYDEMRTKERQLFKQTHNHRNHRPKTEAECRKAIMERDKLDIQRKQQQQKYHIRMLKVLPATKVMEALHQAEKFDKMKFRQMSRERNKTNKQHTNNQQKPRKTKQNTAK